MDSLNTGASNPSGAGIASYLDALTSGGNTISGAGISSYTDALSGSRTAPRAATTPAPVSAAPVAPAAIAPVAATPLAGSGAALAGSSSSYLQALGTGANLSGGGIPTYKDALPSSNVVAGGSGIATHKDNLPSVNVVSGAGLTSYTLSGDGRSTLKPSYAPSGAAKPFSTAKTQSFSGTTTSAPDITFTLEAESIADIIAQLKESGGTIKLTGTIESISFD